ncbi:hypothetical protein [Pyruvatibacter sp.]|uniref:hypothetical protein n=1 Tax=Pyruvatibacter sp. TaxID=1981328 RepID=UPI0032EB251B
MAAQHENDATGGTAEEQEIDAATARTQRVLLVTVIVLGILLIIGFAIVVATIASRIASSGDEAQVSAPVPASVAVTMTGDFEVPVPQGYQIRSVTGDERRLVIHLGNTNGLPERIMVVNTRDGRVVSSLVLTPLVP